MFYTSPKIHKEGNFYRPVVNSINSHTSNLTKLVEHYLQTHIKNLSWCVKDTPDFIKKVRDIQEDTRDTIHKDTISKYQYS